jgi:hypothetical protein
LTRSGWFRYSLRTLLILVTVFCVCLGWQVRIVQKRKAALTEIGEAWKLKEYGLSPSGGMSRGELPFWRYWLGDDDPKIGMDEEDANKIGLERLDEIERLFPDIAILELRANGNRILLPYTYWRSQQAGRAARNRATQE